MERMKQASLKRNKEHITIDLVNKEFKKIGLFSRKDKKRILVYMNEDDTVELTCNQDRLTVRASLQACPGCLNLERSAVSLTAESSAKTKVYLGKRRNEPVVWFQVDLHCRKRSNLKKQIVSSFGVLAKAIDRFTTIRNSLEDIYFQLLLGDMLSSTSSTYNYVS